MGHLEPEGDYRTQPTTGAVAFFLAFGACWSMALVSLVYMLSLNVRKGIPSRYVGLFVMHCIFWGILGAAFFPACEPGLPFDDPKEYWRLTGCAADPAKYIALGVIAGVAYFIMQIANYNSFKKMANAYSIDDLERTIRSYQQCDPEINFHYHSFHTTTTTDSDGNSKTVTHTKYRGAVPFVFAKCEDETVDPSDELDSLGFATVRITRHIEYGDSETLKRADQLMFDTDETYKHCDKRYNSHWSYSLSNLPIEMNVFNSGSSLNKTNCIIASVMGMGWFFFVSLGLSISYKNFVIEKAVHSDGNAGKQTIPPPGATNSGPANSMFSFAKSSNMSSTPDWDQPPSYKRGSRSSQHADTGKIEMSNPIREI